MHMEARVENGKLEVNGDISIIPRSFCTIDELLLFKEETRSDMTAITSASGMGVESPMVTMQSCIVSDDLSTDNLADHGGTFIRENGTTGYLRRFPTLFPAQLFAGKKEGDVIDVIIPKGMLDGNDSFDIKLHLRLAQTKHKYRWSGSFEESFNERMNDLKVKRPQYFHEAVAVGM